MSKSKLKLNYSVGGILWLPCPVCENILTMFHARFDDHIPYCKECRQEYKLTIQTVERKDHGK
jgi:hypothetical protein